MLHQLRAGGAYGDGHRWSLRCASTFYSLDGNAAVHAFCLSADSPSFHSEQTDCSRATTKVPSPWHFLGFGSELPARFGVVNLDSRRDVLEKPPFQILVVDDHDQWRHFICSLLQEQAGLQVVGEATDCSEAIQKAAELKPDLVLLGIGLPKLSGLIAAKRIKEAVPGTKIVFLTQVSIPDVIRAGLSDGACGYILKMDAGAELLPAVEAILRGEKLVSRATEGLHAEDHFYVETGTEKPADAGSPAGRKKANQDW